MRCAADSGRGVHLRKDIEKDFGNGLFDRIAANCDATYVFQELDTCYSQPGGCLERPQEAMGDDPRVLSAKQKLDAPFCVINSDDYYGRGSVQDHGGAPRIHRQ
jgi:hypothetical protein